MRQFIIILSALATLYLACPTGWLSHNDRCFYSNNNNQTYVHVALFCAGLAVNITDEYVTPHVFQGDEVEENEFVLDYYHLTEVGVWVQPGVTNPLQCFEINDARQPARPLRCERQRLSVCETMVTINKTIKQWTTIHV